MILDICKPASSIGKLSLTTSSYHLMIGGAVLFIFSLFMLSLAQPGQYYQVSTSSFPSSGHTIM